MWGNKKQNSLAIAKILQLSSISDNQKFSTERWHFQAIEHNPFTTSDTVKATLFDGNLIVIIYMNIFML